MQKAPLSTFSAALPMDFPLGADMLLQSVVGSVRVCANVILTLCWLLLFSLQMNEGLPILKYLFPTCCAVFSSHLSLVLYLCVCICSLQVMLCDWELTQACLWGGSGLELELALEVPLVFR